MSVSVLVADSSVAIQKVMDKAFRAGPSFNLQFASSYVEARAFLNQNRVDLLICSPAVFPSPQLADCLSENASRNRPSVLLVHGSYDAVDRGDWVKAGVQGFLKKPFQMQDLKAAIKQLGFQFDESSFSMPTPEQVAEPNLSSGPSSEHSSPDLDLGLDAFSQPEGRSHQMTSEEQLLKAQQWMKSAAGKEVSNPSSVRTPEPAEEDFSAASQKNPLVSIENERVFREVVERYCKENFRELAKEILKEELSALVKTKAKLHSDLPI